MKMFKKSLSIMLCLCLFFNSLSLNYLLANAAQTGTNNASANSIVTIDGVGINCDEQLFINYDGSYSYWLNLQTNFSHKNQNNDSNLAQNSYFTVKQPGTYLIELWGGNGADGEGTSYSNGGKGGKGGHIYGTVQLDAGDTLFYSIGGNGTTTLNTSSGGGANGPGGNHGDLGSYNVGGGGGYSAVYKFAPGEFENKYLDENNVLVKTQVDPADRLSKYLMIAGGGGGGGAGNGFNLGISATGNPDGGNGGSVGNLNGTLSGNAYPVEGDFFSGEDGKSSGRSTEYIGHGGSNAPGLISESILSFFSGEGPNDWAGTTNPNYVGGAGGSGQFRGGAGGAGYCGGSGGMMPTLVAALNIGGGGGGSSFISKDVNYSSISPKAQQILSNANPSTTGGAINITYIDENEKSTFNQVEIDVAFSEYIDITSITSTSGTCADWADDKRCYVKISDLIISSANEPTIIKFDFLPVAGFAGGNDVPVFMDDKISISAGPRGSAVLNVSDKCGYFNCPIVANAIGVSHMSNDPNKVYNLFDLYNDKYINARQNPSSFWPLTFVESIGEYVVKDSGGNVLTSPVSPKSTTEYTVCVDLVPKPCIKATVGSVNMPMTLTDKASITILTSSSGNLNGNVINYTKSLEYDNQADKYFMTVDIGAGSDSQAFDKPPRLEVIANQSTYVVSSTSNIKPGYYLFQAWGGNGGYGYGRSRAKGGKGGYVDGFMHLSDGDKININVGKNGEDGYNSRAGGFGGNETRIIINETNTILVAGGGGGGGGQGGYTGLMFGGVGSDSTAIINDPLAPGSQNGTKGVNGIEGAFGAGGDGGAAGGNYESTNISTQLDKLTAESKQIVSNASNIDYGSDKYTANSSGAVYLTCLQLDATKESITQENRDKLDNYSLSLDLSNYFDAIDGEITFTGLEGTPVSSYSNKKLNITGINPTITEKVTQDTGVTNINLSFNCKIKIPLKTIDGFWGGNDVPILVPTQDSINIPNMVLGQDGLIMPIASKDETDYANVSIKYEPVANAVNKSYVAGGSALNKKELYNWTNKPDLSKQYVCDFVAIKEPQDEILTPKKTTSYDIEVGVVAKAQPQKATVIPLAEDKTILLKSSVNVDYQAFYNLTNAKTNLIPNSQGQYVVDSSNNYEVIISGEPGYSNPNSVKVFVDNKEITNYSYNPTSGKLIIPKYELVGAITITAQGIPKEYELNFVYELEPGFGQETKVEKYIAGDAIGQTFADKYVAPTFEGYDFKWDWATYNNQKLDTMPSQNWWVIGQYIAKDYRLTINYHMDGEIFNSIRSMVTYGNSYNYITPTVTGYVADKAVVTGVMPASDLTLDVYYTSTVNQLNIIYIMSDTNEEFNRLAKSINTGNQFNEPSPTVEGYTPDKLEVSGVMTDKGYTEYVYYTPNTYTLTFDSSGGKCGVETRDVVFNRQYNYDGVSYVTLPTPFKLGFKFEGWYLNGVRINDDTIVKTPSNHTVVARWQSATYTLNIKYQYESGLKAADDYLMAYNYNENYSVDSPNIEGYKPDKANLSGTIGATSIQVIVTYTPNKYKLTINYLKEDNTKAFEPVVEQIAYGASYSYIPPELAGHTRSTQMISGVMEAKDKEYTVYYYMDAPVISATVEWSDMTFDYTRGTWNTDTISYSPDIIDPTVSDANKIVVTNNADSTVPIIAEYSSTTIFNTLNGYYTLTNNKADTRITENLIPIGENRTAYYWLEGTIDSDKIGNINVGECTITIRGGK